METIDDIVRDMRIGDIRATANTSSAVERKAFEYINDFLAGYADRIEVAVRECRKTGVRPDGYKVPDEEVTNCNQLKMREALKYLRDASREFCHLILNSKYNEVYDKYKHPEVAKISDAIANAGLVLAEPPRNCDIMSLETARKVM